MHRTEKSHANVLAPMARTIFPPHGLLLAAHFTAIPSLWAGRFQRCHRAWGSNVTSCPLRPKFWAKSFQWCLLKYAKVGPSDAMMQNPYAWRCMALTWLNNTLQAPNETEKIREVFHRHQWSPWDPWASPTLELLERQRFWRVLSVLSRYWVYWGGVQEFSFMRGLAAWHSLTCWQYLALSCTILHYCLQIYCHCLCILCDPSRWGVLCIPNHQPRISGSPSHPELPTVGFFGYRALIGKPLRTWKWQWQDHQIHCNL